MNIYRELLKRENYRELFQSLERKARAEPRRRDSCPVRPEITLRWVLENETLLTRTIRKALRRRAYQPEPCRQTEIYTDKRRIIYSLAWPDRIVESLLARLLGRAVEAALSPNLYSFRRGRSNFLAVQNFGAYVNRLCQSKTPVFIVRHDVSQYGESIDRALLLTKLRQLLPDQDSYFWRLLEAFLAPQFTSSSSPAASRLPHGLPTGFAITPVCENLYLATLDHSCTDYPDLFYARYGDDILLAGSSLPTLTAADRGLLALLSQHKLSLKKIQELHATLGAGAQSFDEYRFTPTRQIDYLGFAINERGKIFISANKVRKLQAELRACTKHAFHAARRSGADPGQMLQASVDSINVFFLRELEQAYFPLLLRTINDLEALRQLDKWLAKLALRYVYGSGHDRVFRRESYAALRKRGLRSLLYLRNWAWRHR